MNLHALTLNVVEVWPQPATHDFIDLPKAERRSQAPCKSIGAAILTKQELNESSAIY